MSLTGVALAAGGGADPAVGTLRGAAVALLIAVGSLFLLVGTIGLLRLPNVYNRMHATSKATTAGAASVFLAGAVYHGPQDGGLVSLVGILFLFLTAPTGSHVISRAAGKMGVPFEPGVEWPGTERDVETDDDATEVEVDVDDTGGSGGSDAGDAGRDPAADGGGPGGDGWD